LLNGEVSRWSIIPQRFFEQAYERQILARVAKKHVKSKIAENFHFLQSVFHAVWVDRGIIDGD
jgi:hypothetical protein